MAINAVQTEVLPPDETISIGDVLLKARGMEVQGIAQNDINEFFRKEISIASGVAMTLEQASRLLSNVKSIDDLLLKLDELCEAQKYQTNEQPQSLDFNLTMNKILSLAFVLIKIKTFFIKVYPDFMKRFYKEYTSFEGDETRSLVEVFLFFEKNEISIASYAIEKVNFIGNERMSNSSFLLDKNEMECLRMVVYLIDSFKLKNYMFCKFGQSIINGLRLYVKQYEDSINQRN